MREDQIIPAILTDTLDDFKDKVRLVEEVVETVQIDYIDGYFAPELTCCEAHIIKDVRVAPFMEIHLMVEEPIYQVQGWYEAGAERLIGHIEEMSDQTEYVETVSDFGMEVGLALSLETPLDELDMDIVESLDVVLLMAHEVGVQGVPFSHTVLQKIRTLRARFPHLPIEVDGGVNEDTISDAQEAGADLFAVGSGIFDKEDPVEQVEKLGEIVRNGR